MVSASESLLEQLPLRGFELDQRKALAGLSDPDAARLARVWPVVQPAVAALVDDYLRWLAAAPEIGPRIADATTPARMRRNLTRFVASMFRGPYDSTYASTRLRLGFVHRRVGLAARYFIAALHRLHVELRRVLAERVADRDEATRAAEALERVLLFDQSLVFDAYEHRLAAEARREHNRALRYAGRLEAQVAARTRALEQLSRTDPLTGLRNRRAFLEELGREVSRARRQRRPLAALYVDVNDFKRLNDREGHARGDEALAAVASTLAGALRGVDVTARLGGDEFCVLLPDTDGERALQVAERLRELVRVGCPVTISIGTATFEDRDATEPEALLRRADAEMYRDKRRRPAVGLVALREAS